MVLSKRAVSERSRWFGRGPGGRSCVLWLCGMAYAVRAVEIAQVQVATTTVISVTSVVSVRAARGVSGLG